MRGLLKKIMADPTLRRRLMVGCIVAAQAREGVTTTLEQAEAAYDRIQKEKRESWQPKKKKRV